MKRNMGSVDKTVRIILGAIIIVLGLYFQTWWGLIGVVLLLTSFLNFCPLYVPFGISTKKENPDTKKD
jgi:hypothetical protein